MQRRQLIQLAAALSAGPAGAQVAGEHPARYLLLSLIGNKLSVITAQMQTGTSQGHGMLEGLGFYIDYQKRMRRSDTGETGQGYLGIFANIQIWLLDCENNKVVREVSFSETTTYSAARSETANDPWMALDAAQKLARLKSLMRTGIARSMPKLLQT